MTEPNAPTASVVIPTYNRAYMLGRAIGSVLNQTYPHWELIVVDDGSVDETESLVRDFNDSRIRYIRHDRNRGQSAAQNTGIRASRGKYVAFLDSDDEWLPEKLAKVIALFESSRKTVGLVYSGKTVVAADGRVLMVRMPTLQGSVYDKLLAWDFIGSCSRVTVRKEILESVGGFDEGIVNSQDWDLWLRVAKISQIAFVNECLVKRYLGSDQVTGSLKSIMEGKEKVVQKHRREMSRSALAKHMANLAAMQMNYDIRRGRQLASEALNLGPFQPTLIAALAASLLGRSCYRWLFCKSTRLLHGLHVGRAAV